MNRIVVAALSFFVAAGVFADVCPERGICQTLGHYARQTSAWPYSEDIWGTGNPPIVVSYNSSWSWTTIQRGCLAIDGANLRASEPVHLLLRAQPTATVQNLPVGTLWESQLILKKPSDPTFERIAAWDQRRIRSNHRDYVMVEHFGNTLQDLPAGDYAYEQRVRIIDAVPGSLTFAFQWTSGLGIPTRYPSGGATSASQTITQEPKPVGSVMVVPAVNEAIDLTSIVSGVLRNPSASNARLIIQVAVDGQRPSGQYGQILVQPQSEGFTAFDYALNLAPGQQHTLQIWMNTTAGTVEVENPTLHYISYPTQRNGDEALDLAEIRPTYASAVETTPKFVSTSSTELPIAAPLLGDCGPWTKLASFEVPGFQEVNDTETDLTALISGYLEFRNTSSAVLPRGEIAIEVVHYAMVGNQEVVFASAELGVSAMNATNGDGMYFSTDGIWSNFGTRNVVTLWARQVTCTHDVLNTGGFEVGKRYFSLKFLPSPGCILDVPPTRGDLTADGKADIVWRNGSATRLWTMKGTTIAASTDLPASDSTNTILGIADFDGDSRSDLLWRKSGGQTEVWTMDGTTRIATVALGNPLTANWVFQGVGDFNGDQRTDVLWRNSDTNEALVWMVNDQWQITATTIAYPAAIWTVQGIGDFNGDSKSDIMWRNSTNNEVVAWLMNGGTIVSSNYVATPNPSWQIRGVSDFSGDKKADLIWRNLSTNEVVVWTMNGASITATGYVATPNSSWDLRSVGDYDGDRKADVMWRNGSTGENAVWLLNGASQLKEAKYVTAVPDLNWTVVGPR